MQPTFEFRKANKDDIPNIWEIIGFAKESRRLEGSHQWQDGYPNLDTINNDIAQDFGYVLTQKNEIVFYTAIIFGIEPAYEELEGKWLSHQPYCVVHRMAVSPKGKGKGLASWMMEKVEDLCLKNQVYSIKIDTNFDNQPMLRLLEEMGYSYCGEVYFRGSARRAYEKVLSLS